MKAIDKSEEAIGNMKKIHVEIRAGFQYSMTSS